MVVRPRKKPRPAPPEIDEEEDGLDTASDELEDADDDEARYDDETPLWDPDEAGR